MQSTCVWISVPILNYFSQYASLVRPIGKTVTNSLMERMINELLSNSRSWAFREPVNVEEVIDYLEFIKEPMGEY